MSRISNLQIGGGRDVNKSFPYVKGGGRKKKYVMSSTHVTTSMRVKNKVEDDDDDRKDENNNESFVKDIGQTKIKTTNTSVTVNTPFIQTNSNVFLTLVSPDPSGPVVSIGQIVSGVSFVIESDTVAGVGEITINWMIINYN
jgi:hypothetical protein